MDKLIIAKWDVSGWAGVDQVSIINPSRHLIELCSEENAEGKTSLLESLRGAIGGAGAIGEGVIREGASKAEVDLDLGPVVVRCTVSQKGRNLAVKTSDGKPVPKAQTYLDGRVGRLLDPSSFRDWKPADQERVLRDLAGAEWLAERRRLEDAEKQAYEARRIAGQRVTSMGQIEPVPEASAVDVAGVASHLKRVDDENRARREMHAAWKTETDRALAEWTREQEARTDKIAAADASILRLKQELAALEASRAAMVAPDDAPPTPAAEPDSTETPTDELRAKLASANDVNRAAAAWDRYCERKAAADKASADHAARESDVARARAELAAHDHTATLPDGLAIGSDGVTYDGRPLARMSTGECYALAFKVAVALGQEILILDNAEALGKKAVDQIQSLAVDNSVQVVMATRGAAHTSGAYELRNGRLVTGGSDE